MHTGYTCDSKWGVFGHYFKAGTDDPWNAVKYTSDVHGVAQIDTVASGWSLDGYSLYKYDVQPVFGRAIVFHGDNARIGCGTIGGASLVCSNVTSGPCTAPSVKVRDTNGLGADGGGDGG